MEKVGQFTRKVIDLLNLPVSEGTPIFMGEVNENTCETDMSMNMINIVWKFQRF